MAGISWGYREETGPSEGSGRARAQSWKAGNEGNGGSQKEVAAALIQGAEGLTSYGSCGPLREAHLPAPEAEMAVRAGLAGTARAPPLTPPLPAVHAPVVSSSPERPFYPP